MNAYSCRPSDHLSDVGMHTLMCIAVLTSGICSDESCTVYDMNMRPSRGNCLVSASVSSVRDAVLNPQVSIPFLRAQGAQVWAVGISPYHRLIMDSPQVKTERITCWGHCFWFPCLGELQVSCCIDRVGPVDIVYSAEKCFWRLCGVICQFTNAQVLQQAMVLFDYLPWWPLGVIRDVGGGVTPSQWVKC